MWKIKSYSKGEFCSMLTERKTQKCGMRSLWCMINLEHVLHLSVLLLLTLSKAASYNLVYYISINSKFHFLILRHSTLPVQSSNRNTTVRYEVRSRLTLSVMMGYSWPLQSWGDSPPSSSFSIDLLMVQVCFFGQWNIHLIWTKWQS